MTERDSTCGIDSSIRCDICNASSGSSDPREPWERGPNNPKPTWRCETCIKAVEDATEQRRDSLYPTVSFPTKEAAEEYERSLKDIGFHTMSVGPSINLNELKRRKFKID